MNSAALVTMRADRLRLEEAAGRASSTRGSVRVVPSAEPAAPGPFDFRRSASLAGAAYRRTKVWLAAGGSAG